MRTRKTFIHEDDIYEGVSRLPEPRELHSREIISLNEAYDWYPEKQITFKKETEKIEGLIDIPLGQEYKLQSQIDNYKCSNHYDAIA